MLKHIKYWVFFLSAITLFVFFAAGCQQLTPPPPAVSESLDTIRFTAQLNGGQQEIRFWGDGDSTFYYFLPSGCGLDSLSVQTQNGITLREEDASEKERLFFSDGATLEGINYNTVYLLGCYDENHYIYELPVVFMQGQNIHSVFIDTEGGSIQPVLDDKSCKLKGTMMVSDETGLVVYEGDLSHIKGRGNGSWYSHKKPFNIKLAESTDLLGMGVSREWCLINQEQDYSCMRNKLIYDLAKDAGMAYSPDSEFVDVWFDGVYNGLYLLTDRINISEASVDITNLEDATQAVNMEKLSDYPIEDDKEISGDSFSLIPNDPEDITGGYLLEVDKFYASDKTARFDSNRIYSITLKSPEYITKNQLNYIKSFVIEMERAVANIYNRSYQNYIDTDSWVAMCVLQEISANGDFMGSSQYFYKDVDVDGKYSKLYASPVWDMDLALGGETANALPSNVLMLLNSSWVKYLYQRPEFYDALVSSYSETFRPLVQELLDYKIDALAEQLQPSAAMNYTRWGAVAEEKIGMENPFQYSVEKLKGYLEDRISFLDDLWVHGTEYHSVLVITDKSVAAYESMYHGMAHMLKDGESLGELYAPTPMEGYVFDGWYYGTLSRPGKEFDLDTPITEDCTIHAHYVPLTE